MQSALSRPRDSLILPMLISIVGHGGMLLGFAGFTFLMTFCGDARPILDPDDAMQVAMVELPRSRTNMPDRATRAPKAVGAPTPEPAPAPDVKHTSDLAVKVDKAEPKPGVDTKRLEDALAQLERDQALADMDAALGQLDQAATDPNSEATEATATSGTLGTPGDPAFVRYIAEVRAVFLDNFQVIPAIRDANPGIQCTVMVQVDATGAITDATVSRSSGVDAFDAAAMRAVQAVTRVPLPPEQYRDRMAQGYAIDFK
jgi:TonB family protein